MNGKKSQKSTRALRLSFMSKHKTVLIAIVIVLIAAVSAVVFLYISGINNPLGHNDTRQDSQTASIAQVVDRANNAAISGDIAAAAKELDGAASVTADAETQYFLKLNKATMYMDNADYGNALDVALSLEAIRQDANIKQVIAMIYSKKGDNQNAIKYYNQAIQLVDSSQLTAKSDIVYYNAKIDALKKLKGQ